MVRNTQLIENNEFKLSLELGKGEQVLQSIRLEAESARGAWYELYLVMTLNGFLIEKHSGVSFGFRYQKETWFRRTLSDAEEKYYRILNSKLNKKRHSPRKYQVSEFIPPLFR